MEWQRRASGRQHLEGVAIASGIVATSELRCGLGVRSMVRAFRASSGHPRWVAKDAHLLSSNTSGSNMALVDIHATKVTIADAKTGRTRWRLRGAPPYFVGNTLVLNRVIRSQQSPLDPGVIKAFDRTDGTTRWSFAIEREFTPATPVRIPVSNRRYTLLALGGADLPGGGVDTATQFIVLDSRSGREIERFAAAQPELTFSDVALEGTTIVLLDGNQVVAHELGEATPSWAWPDARPPEPPSAGSVAPATTLRVGSDNRTVYLQTRVGAESSIEAIDTQTGDRLWKRAGTVLAASGQDAIVVTDRRLAAFDARTGIRRWMAESPIAWDPNTFHPSDFAQATGRLVALSTPANGSCNGD